MDRGKQIIKKDIVSTIARKSGTWDTALDPAIMAYNERPHEAVFGPPEEVGEGGVQDYFVLKANAAKCMQNELITVKQS